MIAGNYWLALLRVVEALARLQSVERLGLGLFGVAAGLVVSTLTQLLLRAGKIVFRGLQMGRRQISRAGLPGYRNRLPSITHLLNRRRSLTSHEACDGNEQANLQGVFQTRCEILICHGFFLFFLGVRSRSTLPIHAAPRQVPISQLTIRTGPARVRFASIRHKFEDFMAVTIYHNPRCSKSRKTLELITESGAPHSIILYLEESPDAAAIVDLADKLGMPVADLLRRGESEFKEATDIPDLADDASLAEWVAAHPIVLERPIVVNDETGDAVIGRPPENVLSLLS